jgi:transcriptional regulator with XRE-family HTH domain
MPTLTSQPHPEADALELQYAQNFGAYLRYIREQVFAESLRQFAPRVGLSPGYLNRLECATVNAPRRSTVIAIAHALGQDPSTLLLKAGYSAIGHPVMQSEEYILLKLRRLPQPMLSTVLTIVDALAAKCSPKEMNERTRP